MKNIAIIGVGQIGSRHLQAMAFLEGSAIVQLVDFFDESLKIAEKRFYEVYDDNFGKITLKSYMSIDELEGPIDLAIIATCSDVRADVIKELIEKKEVKTLILEKVLFQTVDEYFEIEKLLKEKAISAWVNCWMREKAFYRTLKSNLDLNKGIQMEVTGSGWGMCCNSIHFIDLFCFLTDVKEIDLSEADISEVVPAKRERFKEMFGVIKGNNFRGDSILISCNNNDGKRYGIKIINGSAIHEIDNTDKVIYKFLDGVKTSTELIEIPPQSLASHHLVHGIIDNKSCDLTPYNDSMKMHITLIRNFNHYFEKMTGKEVRRCPIT